MWSVTSLSPPPTSSSFPSLHPTWDSGSQPEAEQHTYQVWITQSRLRRPGWCAVPRPLGSTKACLPVLFTAETLEGSCALDRSQILREDEIRAVYLSPCPLMFLRLLSQAFNPFVSHLPFICDLVF